MADSFVQNVKNQAPAKTMKAIFLKRKPIFWAVQIGGLILIAGASLWFSFSLPAVLSGAVLGYLNMALLLKIFRPGISFSFLILKAAVFLFLIYVLLRYLDGFSFLFGISSQLLYLMGLSLEVLKHDSL